MIVRDWGAARLAAMIAPRSDDVDNESAKESTYSTRVVDANAKFSDRTSLNLLSANCGNFVGYG